MRKIFLLLFCLIGLAASAQQTRPTTPVQKAQNSAYLDTSTGIRWYFDGVNWFAIPPYSPPNTLLTGLSMTVVSSTLTVHTGTWRIGNVVYTLGSNTNFTLKPRDTITHYYRYEAVYAIKANNGIGLKVDSLTPSPIQHQFGTDTLTVGYVLVTPTGYQVVPPIPTNQFVFSNIGVGSPVQQVGSYPWVTSLKADTIKVGGHYILPSIDGTSGQVIQTDGAGNLFWSNQAIYLPLYPITISANNIGVDTAGSTRGLVTHTALMDTLLKNAANFNPKQFIIGNDTINLSPRDTTTVDSVLGMKNGRLYKGKSTGGTGVLSLSNGLTLTGTDGVLGGSLNQNTDILTGASNYLKITSATGTGNTAAMQLFNGGFTANFIKTAAGNSFLQANLNGSGPQAQIGYQSPSTAIKSAIFGLTNTGIPVTDGVTSYGFIYASDYSVNQRLQRLSIPSVGTTIALIDSVKGTISGGITALTGDVIASGTGSVAATIGAGKVTNTMLAGSIDLTSKVTGLLPVANGGTGTSSPGIVAGTNVSVSGTWPNQTVNATGGSGTATPTASTISKWDANVNFSANNFIPGYQTIAAAGGTTTLSITSPYQTLITGTTTQTITLPVASTLPLGYRLYIANNSTGTVTVQSSGANTVQAMIGGSFAVYKCILASGTSAASWSVDYSPTVNFASGTWTGDGSPGNPYTLATDATPTSSSLLPIQSGGVYTALAAKASLTGVETLTNKTLTSPQINTPKLNTSSTVGYIWTATGTDGSGGWAAPTISGTSLGLGQLATSPSASATGSTVGGALTAGTYYYKIVGYDAALNPSLPGAEFSATVASGTTGKVTIPFTTNSSASSYRIYRGTSAGAENVYYTMVGNVAPAASLTFVDVGGTSTGGTPPVSNTSNIDVLQTAYTASQGIGQGGVFAPILTSSASNDILSALTINPGFVVSGGHTNVQKYALYITTGQVNVGVPYYNLASDALSVTGGIRTNFLNLNTSTNNVQTGIGNNYPYLQLSGFTAYQNGTTLLTSAGLGATATSSPVAMQAGSLGGSFTTYNFVQVGNAASANTAIGGASTVDFYTGFSPQQKVGQFTATGSLALMTGITTKVATAGGKIKEYYTDAGNTTTTETDLYSYTTEASILNTNGASIKAEYGGTFVSSATATRDLKVYFGGTVLFDSGALTISTTAQWAVNVSIIRVSSTVVRYMVSLSADGVTLTAPVSSGEVTGLTLSSTNILKITGQAAATGAATNDIVAKLGAVYYWPVSI